MKTYKSDQLTASIAEFRANLSAHLDVVKAGGEVLITDRGRPVARVVAAEVRDTLPEGVASLVREGQAREPRRPLPADFLDRPRPCDVSAETLAAVLEERAEGP